MAIVLVGLPVGLLLLRDRARPVSLATRAPSPLRDLQCSGAFVAQFDGGFASPEFGTIFQFFAYPDRLVLIGVGSFLNQIPIPLLTHGLLQGTVGLADHSAHGLPSLKTARAIVERVNSRAVLGTSAPSREIMAFEIRRIEHTHTFAHDHSLRIHLVTGEPLLFHFANGDDAARAAAVLGPVFAGK